MNWYHMLFEKIAQKIGYTTALQIEDFMLYEAGMIGGLIIAVIIMSRMLMNIRREDLPPGTLAITTKDGKNYRVYIDAKTHVELLDILATTLFLRVFRRTKILYKDRKRTRVLALVFTTLFIGIAVFGFLCIFVVHNPPDPLSTR